MSENDEPEPQYHEPEDAEPTEEDEPKDEEDTEPKSGEGNVIDENETA